MCQSQKDGGQRCAAHTRPAYLRWTNNLNNAETADDPIRLVECETKWHTAAANYAATPSGNRNLTTELETTTDPRRAAMLTVALRTAANQQRATEAAQQAARREADRQADAETKRRWPRSNPENFLGPDGKPDDALLNYASRIARDSDEQLRNRNELPMEPDETFPEYARRRYADHLERGAASRTAHRTPRRRS